MSGKTKGWIAMILALLLAAGVIVHGVLTTKPAEVAAAPVEEPVKTITVSQPKPMPIVQPEPESEPEPLWHFYNLDLQDNGDEVDDYNFGPTPSISEAASADMELRTRMRQDPALGAAVMAWADSILGTRYLGVFFSECHEDWDAAMNRAKEAWIVDKDDYDATLDAFFKKLDKATKEIQDVKGLADQMYMDSETKSGIPDIIVMESDDHEGRFLAYTFVIKETAKKTVSYRIDCGFQPTNVAEIMKITPKKKVTGGGGGGVISGGGKKTGVISGGGGKGGSKKPDPDPKPQPDPKPKNKKDPTKGTKVLPNDVPGPGSNTNGDPNWSSKDQPTNSNHMTPDEYWKAIEELKEINTGNGNGQPGGTPNTPSTPTPADVTSDNNGDAGTGNGGIDQPTPVSPGSSSSDPPGDSWDGPPDA